MEQKTGIRGTGSNGTKNGYKRVKKWIFKFTYLFIINLKKRKKGIAAFWIVEQYKKIPK